MTRPLRIDLAGALYHVTSRGDRREDIFHDNSDREDWLSLLEQVCERFNWRCHAYCQMTNHYHVVVETPDANLSHGMRQLNGVYKKQGGKTRGSGLALPQAFPHIAYRQDPGEKDRSPPP